MGSRPIRRGGQGKRSDAVTKDGVAALRRFGVWCAFIVADGVPDVLCHHQMTGLFLFEFKSDKGKLTPAQERTRAAGVPFFTPRSAVEAVDMFLELAKVRRRK